MAPIPERVFDFDVAQLTRRVTARSESRLHLGLVFRLRCGGFELVGFSVGGIRSPSGLFDIAVALDAKTTNPPPRGASSTFGKTAISYQTFTWRPGAHKALRDCFLWTVVSNCVTGPLLASAAECAGSGSLRY